MRYLNISRRVMAFIATAIILGCSAAAQAAKNDFDGDGKSDVAVPPFHPHDPGHTRYPRFP